MPTKGRELGVEEAGVFERIGRRADQGILWLKKHISQTRETYRGLNTDYIKIIRKNKIFRILPPSLILLTIFFVIVPFFAVQIFSDDVVTLVDSRNDVAESATIIPTEAIREGEITQELHAREGWDDISDIGVLFGTYMRTNHADYEFLLTKDGEVIHSEFFSATTLKDGEYYRFRFEESIDLSPESKYAFSIRPINTSEQDAVALFQNSVTGDAIYKVNAWSGFHDLNIVFSVIFLFIFLSINILVNSDKIKSEFHFLAYTLAYIIPLVFIYPAYTVPDEPYHFVSALRLAEYDFSKPLSDNLSDLEYNLPSNSECLASYYQNTDTPEKITRENLLACFASEPNETKNYIVVNPTSRILAYAPAALGIKFGDLISDSPMVIFYCGRIFNLIATSAIIVFAISLLKKHRLVLLSVVFIPMFLQQAISYSYDGILNSLCLLIIAYGIRFLTTDAKVRKRDIVIMAIALAFIGLIKLPYVIVAAPLLFVKSEKFSKHKWVKWLVALGLLVAMVTPYVIDNKISVVENSEDIVAVNDPDLDQRGHPIESLLHPRSVIKIFLKTLYFKKAFYINSLIGYFGWFYFALDDILIMMYVAFLIIAVLSDREERLNWKVRIWTLFAAIVLSMSFLLVMYLEWSTLSSPLIEGVQGRYFLPVVPLLMLAFIPKKQKLKLPTETAYTFLSLSTFCFVITLLLGFY